MRIAVTDACIFIDVIDLQLTSHLFGLELEIHTSLDVFNELYAEQQQLLRAYQSVNKLVIHNINSDEKTAIVQEAFPKSLSENDKTVIFLARKLDAMLLSSDKAVRHYARLQSIEYHGMLWIFDCLLEYSLIQHSDAIQKLTELTNRNIVYQNNAELMSEVKKRIRAWTKKIS
jgi:hypothetical protein